MEAKKPRFINPPSTFLHAIIYPPPPPPPFFFLQGTNVCGQIYVDRELTSCIYDRYLSEMFLPHIFGDCVKAICGTSKSQCEILKQHIRGIHCPMPKALEDLDCNSLGSSPAHDDMLHDSFTNDNDTSH